MKSAMRPALRPALGLAAAAVVMLAGAALAQTQMPVSPPIASEPTEAVLAPGPDLSGITFVLLTPELGLTTYAPPPDRYAPLAADALTPQYVEPFAPPLIPATVTAQNVAAQNVAAPAAATVGASERPPARSRSARSSTRNDIVRVAAARSTVTPNTARRVAALSPAAPVSDQALVLSQAQRQLIYRIALQSPPRVARLNPYTERNYPLRAIYPADDSYVSRASGGYAGAAERDFGDQALGYQDNALDPYHTAYRWNGIPLVVGARIPPSVPLAALPEAVAARVPAARPYGYAVLDNRVLLVDPSTGIIVAAIAP
jgi:hypothetical protein